MSAQVSTTLCTKPVVDALYQLRIEADKYSTCAAESRTANELFEYKLYTEKATALDSLIREFISQLDLSICAQKTEIHVHNSVWYYCVSIQNRLFYIPYSAIDYRSLTNVTKKTVDSLTPIQTTDYTESEAVTYIAEKFASPNTFLSTPFVTVGDESAFAGWRCLEDSITINDKVTEKHRQVYDLPSLEKTQDSFRLEVGDEFVTKDTSCVVTNKYQMWAESIEDSVYVRPRKAYDLRIGSDEFNGICEDTILVDWGIQVQTLTDPLPDVSSQFTSSLPFDSVTPEFDVGDVIYVDISDVRYVKYKLQKVVATLSGVYCYIHPVEDPSIDVSINESPARIILSLEELTHRFIE